MCVCERERVEVHVQSHTVLLCTQTGNSKVIFFTAQVGCIHVDVSTWAMCVCVIVCYSQQLI